MNLFTLRHDEGDCKATLQKHTDVVSAIALHAGERRCFTGSWDRTVLDWDLDTGQDVREIGKTRAQVTSVRPQPMTAGEGNLVATSSIDGSVMVWDCRTPEGEALSFQLPDRTSPWAMSVAWSTDGQRLFCGRKEPAVDEWDIRNPSQHRRIMLPKDSGPVYSVQCMQNNRQLLWCVQQSSGRQIFVLLMWIPPFAFSASYDNIRLWLLDEPAEPLGPDEEARVDRMRFIIVPGHSFGTVAEMLVDRTGKHLVTVSGDRGWPDMKSTNAAIVYSIS